MGIMGRIVNQIAEKHNTSVEIARIIFRFSDLIEIIKNGDKTEDIYEQVFSENYVDYLESLLKSLENEN